MEKVRKKIMLVDDNITNLTIGKNALIEKYDVFTMPSAEKLFKILTKIIPDLILLDVEMPEMNGYEAIRKLKQDEKTADIPVVFLTAKNDEGSELKGFSLGAIDYIKKPFSAPLLLKRIESHLLMEEQKVELKHYNENLQDMVDEKTKTIFELQNTVLATVAELVECRDDITGEHIGRTQSFLKILVKELTRSNIYSEIVSQWDLKFLIQSAQLHDVGKIGIRDDILMKPGKLTEAEFEIMKTHTTFGVKVIEKIATNTIEGTFLSHAKIFAGSHHERWDGSGYPGGLKGEEIPLQGRLMAIADVYDALISRRPYKDPFDHERALEIIMEGRGTHFDPCLVDLFLSVADEFDRAARNIS